VIDAVPEDDGGLDLVTAARGLGAGRTEWCARWLVPGAADRGVRYRFFVERLDGTQAPAGEPFRIASP
jgi:heme oxygenase